MLREGTPEASVRLRLRGWREGDRAVLRRLNSDPRVMRFFPALLTAEESDGFWLRMRAHQHRHGYSLWAVEEKQGAFVGLVGLAQVGDAMPCAPAVEIGWRLLPEYWGKGYATEAAQQALAFGFQVCGLREIVAFTAALNLPSRKVMERLSMHHDLADDFDHPRLP
ncbi:MAG: GNAT family N-acetyltransferase, partial [Bilophila sp.]